jgi:hypothetical protein
MHGPLRDALSEQPTALSIVGGVGAAIAGAGMQEDWGSWRLLGWIVLLGICVGVPAWSANLNRLGQHKRAAAKGIRKVLEACAVAYGYPSKHVRSNIMRLCQANQRRRCVDPELTFNMTNDPDRDLEIDAAAGVTGEVWTHRTPVWGDLGLVLQHGGPSWGLRPAEIAKVRRELRSILSVPIFDPENSAGDLLGTLQVDSDLTFSEMGFDVQERREIAERFADVIALLLKTGR